MEAEGRGEGAETTKEGVEGRTEKTRAERATSGGRLDPAVTPANAMGSAKARPVGGLSSDAHACRVSVRGARRAAGPQGRATGS